MRALSGLLIVLVLASSLGFAAGVMQWNATYGGPGYDGANSAQQTADGGYIVAGYTTSFGAGSYDFWLIKTNSTGGPQWNVTYGGAGYDDAISVQQTADGGYILAGTTDSFGAGNNDFWLVKTNSTGGQLWNATFGGSGDDVAYSVRQTSDGGYMVAGQTHSFGAGGSDVWLIKTNSTGGQLWNATFGGSGDEISESVKQTADGGYIAAGYTASFGAGNADFWLIKTNSTGGPQWNVTFGGAGYDAADSVQQTSDGGYMVAGQTYSFGAGSSDAWLIKTNSTGGPQWNVTFGGTGLEWASSVQQTADGGYIVDGPTDSFGAGNLDFWLIKTNSTGGAQWNVTFGGTGHDWPIPIQQTTDGGYMMAGATASFGAGSYDFWLVNVYNDSIINSCPVISAPGTYQLLNNIAGAPNNASEIGTGVKACVKVAASNVMFDCAGNNITNNGTAGTTYGILLSGPITNVTVRNCANTSGYYGGIYVNNASNSFFLDDGAFGNAADGLTSYYSNYNTIANSSFSYNNDTGITLEISSNYTNISNVVVAYDGYPSLGDGGIYIRAGSNNNMLNNITAYNDGYYGLFLNPGSNNIVENSNICNSSYTSIWLAAGSNNNTFVNVTASFGGRYGTGHGFYSSNTSSNTLINFTSHDNANQGAIFDVAGTGNAIYNSTFYNNGNQGFAINGAATNSTFANIRTSNNTNDGVQILTSNNLLVNVTSFNNNGHGITFALGNNYTLINSTAYGNHGYGMRVVGGNINLTMVNAHFYNTSSTYSGSLGYNFLVNNNGATSDLLDISGTTFDNPNGNFQNFTNLSIYDVVGAGQEYGINWSAQPAAPNPGYASFMQKFVTITAIAGAPSIDSIAWSWNSSELAGYNKTQFELWKYNATSNWTKTNATLDTSANTLTLASMTPASTYGILENDVLPNVSLQVPVAGYNASKRSITFNCSANASTSLTNMTLYGNFTGSWQANATNSVGGLSNSTEFTLNLPYARYSWNCLAYDTGGRSAWAPANYTFTVNSLPIDSNFGGSTTDFSSELDLTNVSTPILENITYVRLQWNNTGLNVAGADFNSYVLFGTGWISVDSFHLSPTLNSPANITLYGLPYQYTPVVYADGVLCTSECTILSYVSHNLAFTVPHFTNYSAGPNTNLAIYDQYEGSNVSKLTPITFYANYTNATDSSHVAGATCTISFDDATSGTMVDTGSQYNYTKVAGFSTTGIHLWNVTCNKTGYETLFAQDDVDVGPLNLTGNTTSLYQATVNASVALPRFVYNATGNISSEGGNISGVDVSTEQLTDRWAAFYGNITGSIMLTDKAGANNVYQWGWTPASGGVVCTSTNSSVTDLMLYPADGDDIDAAWSFAPTEVDSGRNTFNQTGCSLTIGTTPITNAGYADTGQAGGFITCSLKDTTIAAKQDMYFCTNITQNGVFWNNEVGDFELMVPTAFGNNVYETYYFYVNLD